MSHRPSDAEVAKIRREALREFKVEQREDAERKLAQLERQMRDLKQRGHGHDPLTTAPSVDPPLSGGCLF